MYFIYLISLSSTALIKIDRTDENANKIDGYLQVTEDEFVKTGWLEINSLRKWVLKLQEKSQQLRTMRPAENRNYKGWLSIKQSATNRPTYPREYNIKQSKLIFPNHGKSDLIKFYYPSLPIACNNPLSFLVFYLPNEYNNSSSFPNYALYSNQNHSIMPVFESKPIQFTNSSSKADDQLEAKFSITNEQLQREPSSTQLSPSEALKEKKMKLNFRVKWCNQYRNIVPNLINQLMSFLLKRVKSEKIIRKFFAKLSLPSKCTIARFYLYMRGMRDSFSHYLNEAVLTRFFELQEPNLQVYSYEEQISYMKVCRMAVQHFLANDSLVLTLICQKMSSKKKQLHLVGRRALLDKFRELARQNQ